MKTISKIQSGTSLTGKGLGGLIKAAVFSAFAFGSLASETLAADLTLRLHQFLPAQAAVPKNVLIPWMEKVEKESDGRIKFEHYPAMQLGGTPPQLYDQAVDGVADIIWSLPGYSPGRFPRVEVFELPFTMTNAEAVSRAYWELAQETMMDTDFKDTKVLGLWVHGPGAIHSKEPITSVSDLNGVKLRAPTRVTNTFFKNLGATPVGMPIPAVPEALSKGVIDATVVPWEVTGALKTSELVHNHTEFGAETLYTAAFILTMNKEKYNALPDDLKAVIDKNSGMEFSAMAGKITQMEDAGPRQKAVDLGNNIVTLTPEQIAEWKTAADQTIKDWVAEMDEKGMDGTGLVARAAELIKKYSE
ncbi:TRAP transporter substrate-binding protein [uncultured Cohaesibacter sp.]|uniref:TRAP transporter substrate-binding protein n=1 Tax=uncultured Cohaesibacter sp. TaxID=1002546 RepID=UPI0029C69ED3|nr:TRAP transporter substrate-binding protein [uncultured Cohaesibacter sp.]